MSARERGLVPFQGKCEGDGCEHIVTCYLPRANSVPNGSTIKVKCRECRTTNNLEVGYVE